ncbi:hypothetical protein [Arthrobacter sp. S2(2024)]|uniref:hypothetical protein n=1 Tax=Arthrobacter sp. S2(2024) TaxID=3111911 RepID=UPI002FC62FA1
MTYKLNVLVRVDLDCAHAQIRAQGRVTAQSIDALYVIVKRANALMSGLAVEIDMVHASVEPDALDQLRACSLSHHLPAHIDPFQSNCRLSILTAGDAFAATGTAARAA